MKVYRYGEDKIERRPEASVTLGTFDGVHQGHRALLNSVLKGECSTLITFYPHPQLVLKRHLDKLMILTPLKEKLIKLELLGLERVIIIPFDKALSEMSASDFLKEIIIDTVGAKRIVVGFNHFFGKNREGNLAFLQENREKYGYDLEIVDAYIEEQMAVSSTIIRKSLIAGLLDEANAALGRRYRIEGCVVRGDGRGKDLGYPTANIEPLMKEQLIPAEGVYAVRIHLDDGKWYDGVASIGRKETFGDSLPVTVEVHLFNFDEDLYDQIVHVEWVKYLREQEQFKSVADLITQLDKDCIFAKKELELTETY